MLRKSRIQKGFRTAGYWRGVDDKALRHVVENARTITYNEALREANKETFFREPFIPPAEFELKEIDLQNAYKNFRARNTIRETRKARMKIK